MYKALVMDLDGTAVRLASLDGSDVTEETKLAITQAQNQGCLIAAATGRPWDFAKQVIHALGLRAPCIIDGGTRIIDPATDSTRWEKFLDDGAAKKTLELVKRESAQAKLAFAGEQSQSVGKPLRVSALKALPANIRALYFLELDESTAQRLATIINARKFAAAHITPSWAAKHLDLHVTHAEGTKEHALAVWHELVHVNKAETIAMGDSANDIPLFQSAGLKVAVRDATSDLKKLADYIAPAQKDEALRHVIEKFLLR